MSSIEDGRQFAFPEGAIRKDMSSKRYIILVGKYLFIRHKIFKKGEEILSTVGAPYEASNV